VRVTRFDRSANFKSKHKKVTLMMNSNERVIKHKIGLLNLAEELGNVSQACKMMGLSRDTFYRYKEAVEDGGVKALWISMPRFWVKNRYPW
jgi:transcriptional regulator of acetoin/glycerol metabolism